MFAVIRFIYSTLAGIAVAAAFFVAVELFSMVVHPFPADMDMHDPKAIHEHVRHYPHWILAAVVPMWLGLAYSSTWIATRLGNLIPGIAVGGLGIAMFSCNVLTLPYPTWFSAAILVGYPIAVFLALFPYIWPNATNPAKPVLA